MDLATTINSIAARGAMFWAATGSVALGGTLILVAVVAQLRGLNRKRALRHARVAVPEPPQVEELAPGEEEPVVPAVKADPVQAHVSATPPSDDRELRQLLTRLRSAADRLEEFRRRSGKKSVPSPESPLKETVSPVDYVFRAGLG
jgi:hypothetical protein